MAVWKSYSETQHSKAENKLPKHKELQPCRVSCFFHEGSFHRYKRTKFYEDQTVFGAIQMLFSNEIKLYHFLVQWGLQNEQIFWCLSFLCDIILKNTRNTLSVYLEGKILIWRLLTEWNELLLLGERFTQPWWFFLACSFHQVLLGCLGRNTIACQPQQWSILRLSTISLVTLRRCWLCISAFRLVLDSMRHAKPTVCLPPGL